MRFHFWNSDSDSDFFRKYDAVAIAIFICLNFTNRKLFHAYVETFVRSTIEKSLEIIPGRHFVSYL